MAGYSAVTNKNQGSFNNPRQKTWGVFQCGNNGWYIAHTTNCFDEVKEEARKILNRGGQYCSIDRIMVVEIVPIDTVMTPSV
ncbi:hypothetical protein [Hathewaya massiliensis]|uniref:hypothetical protein n=1 Tax=Hathewaya massiliensis TaxID=1964382 RepID=UPI0011585518|nr:hypothetical protein [Hathewaya massiliensis]